MNKRIWKFCLMAIASLLLCWGCSTNNPPQQATTNSPGVVAPASGVNTVQVTVKEMAFQLSKSNVPAGDVEFVVTNEGRLAHEMELIKTDLPIDKLPLTNGDRLDIDKAGKKIAEIEADELKSDTTKTLKVNLTPGKYLIVCNIPGHFQAGMRTILTVT
ncbi:cupredoxin domain-containing protein [Chlorogloeopsis sp. ULAP01]|uniref:sulfocyanin-like copper-binding protein n=1 Tax=Chlorogloeopsis sp. ULAP01 TaxID=3056483 RepID=UPI0025AACA76|nr:cupredoxin domain-containing protein [Chlorogloeopsis sp. ULAP01]MDM9379481.1 cupredoxin domain-containing protein [Chlorogloeopsis sp. ULAP01]